MNQQLKTDSCQVTLLDYLHSLVGLPYAENGRSVNGMDCYGLLWLVYSEYFHTGVPALSDVYTGEVTKEDLSVLVDTKSSAWSKTDTPNVGDVILFRMGNRRHVGIWLSKSTMLHSVEHSGTCIERYDNIRWKAKIIGIYRHKSHR